MTYHSPKWWKEFKALSRKHQAASSEGSSEDLRSLKPQATEGTSNKPQAPSGKHQASSRKQQAAR